MNNNTQLGIGMTGTIVAGLCIFTPGPAIWLDAAGLSGTRGWLDPALLVALVGFAGLFARALFQRTRSTVRQRG